MTFDLKQFSHDLKVKRLNPYINLVKASEAIGIGSSTIANIESGRSKDPSVTIVIKVCEWLGKNINDYIK